MKRYFTKTGEDAQRNMASWLNATKNNYEVLTEEDISCSGQSYRLITYNCVSKDNPYSRGISALGVCGSDAMCVELACREDFGEDLRAILIHFLDGVTVQTGH